MSSAADAALAYWRHEAHADGHAPVPPDGCCDIILHERPGRSPVIRPTRLQDRTAVVPLRAGDRYLAVRLRPGVVVDERALAARPEDDVRALLAGAGDLGAVTVQSPAVAEALAAIAALEAPIATVARSLGVTPRTLERTVGRPSGRPPSWWRRLARVRGAALALVDTQTPLAHLAVAHGFADQAHLSREVRAWLGATPSAVRADRALALALRGAGYGAAVPVEAGRTGVQSSTR